MAGKLDQSLDEILSTRRAAGRGRGRPARRAGRGAPSGGIQKNTTRANGKATGKSVGTVPASGDSKIIVSNLVRPPNIWSTCKDANTSSLLMSTKARSRYVEQQPRKLGLLAVLYIICDGCHLDERNMVLWTLRSCTIMHNQLCTLSVLL